MNFRRWADGALIGVTDTSPAFTARYGAPYNVVHRAHLHAALHQQAEALGVRLRLNSKVDAYDVENAAITLADGTVFSGDLVVAADGVKSLARALVAPNGQGAPQPTGFAVYRATVDVEKMRACPELSWILDEHNLNLWIGEDRHVMTYSIAGGRSFNMVLSHRDKGDPAQFRHEEDILGDMRREFDGWDPQLTHIISLVTKALKTPLTSGTAPLPTWLAPSSKLVLLGDAAHAMLPYMSQGAAMAVEDGAALAVALSKLTRPALAGIESASASASASEFESVSSPASSHHTHQQLRFALHLFQQERIRRTSMMQEASLVNSMIWHFADGLLQRARDEAMKGEVQVTTATAAAAAAPAGQKGAAAPTTPWTSPNQWSDPVTQNWAYGYDAEKAMEEAWERGASVREVLVGQW
ncbi:hypothetical protein BD289DRAFT_446730 [Coniella lustricola]|uniref:FAD-binding domain-containing protein n=1 Tax=Coniella lustricola TaxID=2025994 RepID=A0A2T2ZTL9_9PEZI|nr:hypothetical protein BD289DRAFT_446730 [Coniella lustricola]